MITKDTVLQAVLLFYTFGRWTGEHQRMWEELTGRSEVTTRALCETVREVLEREEGVKEDAAM